ncbi:MAG: SPOR domain-containing protein [Vicinamibacterales bacterium]
MNDESLREIQLNGKQLVFLFMASTVVAVVIFLCGVMVGRGVSAAQSAAVTNSTVETGDPTAGEVPEPSAAAPSAPPADIAPDAPGDEPDLKYPTALTGSTEKPELETPKSAPKAAAPRPAEVVRARAAAPAASPAAAPRTAVVPARSPEPVADTEPGGAGFVVQVAATPRRAEADAIRARLQKKGYPAFVTTAGRVFRVRVGKYKDRAEAAGVSKRLETEERFKPWVTR